MKSEDLVVIEMFANLGLICGLNYRLRDDQMDGAASVAMTVGGILGMLIDAKLLADMASKHDQEAPMATYVHGSELLAGVLLVTLCSFAALAARHVIPAGAKACSGLIFSSWISDGAVQSTEPDLEEEAMQYRALLGPRI